jgi:hypothetical protein
MIDKHQACHSGIAFARRSSSSSAPLRDLLDAPTALAACCGFDLCHKYILYLYLYLYFLASAVRALIITGPPAYTCSARAGGCVVLAASSFNELAISGLPTDPCQALAVSISEDPPTGTRVSLASMAGLSGVSGCNGSATAVPCAFSGTAANIASALRAGVNVSTASALVGPRMLVVNASCASSALATARFTIMFNAPGDVEGARNALLAGVTSIPVANPGYMLAFGDHAFIIARYPGATAYTDGPLIAAALWGAGRVVAVPSLHTLDTYSFGATASTFYSNIVSWLARSSSKSVKIVVLAAANAPFFATAGFTNVVAADVTSPAGLASALAGASVLWAAWMGTNVPSGSIAAIRSFVAGAGGGVAIAEYGIGYTWWWNMALPSVPGNMLLREAGICFLGGNRWDGPTIDATNRPAASEERVSALLVLAMVNSSVGFTATAVSEAMSMMGGLFTTLLPADPLFMSLQAFYNTTIEGVSPTPSSPVTDDLEKALLHIEAALASSVPVRQVRAHRTAAAAYGAVPIGAARVTRVITVPTMPTNWHPTGLYLVPGEVATVWIGAALVGLGFRVVVSGHGDDISVRPAWFRVPSGVQRQFALSAPIVEIATAFGGALYVDTTSAQPVLTGAAAGAVAHGAFNMTVSGGVVEAPMFVLGKTSNSDWVGGGLRAKPAPYAELVSPHVSISIPSSYIRSTTDMVATMQFWDDAVSVGMLFACDFACTVSRPCCACLRV